MTTANKNESLNHLLSPALFAEWASKGKWKLARHLHLLSKELRAVCTGQNRRLIVQMPPRHGKSELTSKYFPAWYLGVNPTRKVILSSSTSNLATNFSGQCRDVLLEHGKSFGVNVRRDKHSASEWKLKQGAECRSVGVGGAVFGFGAHLAIIDDYCGSIESALSQAERDSTHRWFHGTIRNRLEDEKTGAIVIVATRYHTNDLVGRLLKEQSLGGDQWRVLNLCALAGDNDPLGRKPGEALWPERWGRVHLERERQSLAASGYPWMFDALYQGEPPSVLDSEFPTSYFSDDIWFDLWPAHKEVVSRAVYVDPSMGKTNKSDYSAIIAVAKDIHGTYWIDADIQRRPVTQIAADAVDWFADFQAEALGCETNAFQELVGDHLKEEARRRAIDCLFVGFNNSIDKRVRIRRLTSPLAESRIRFKRGSPGVALLLEQLRGFPSHKHDDGPDALEGGIRLVNHTLNGTIHQASEGVPQYVGS